MQQRSSREPVLKIQGLDSYYRELRVLRNASLHLDEGEVVALFGPNGHGKSTLLKAICGLHQPRHGSIVYRGCELVGLDTDKIVALGVAYIPENRNLFPEMTVKENLVLGAFNRKARKSLDRNLANAFALFPRLLERKNQLAATLSGGESRMLAVARGLMSNASLLLIDEPSIGLSPIMKKAVFGAIGRIKAEARLTVLMVEQEVEYPLKLSERIYLLKKGHIIMEAPADRITKADIEKAYF